MKLLEAYKNDELNIDQITDEIADLPYQDLGFAKIDHHRELRKGFPEVIYGKDKTPAQIHAIAGTLIEHNSTLLITKTNKEVYDLIAADYDDVVFHEASGMISRNLPEKPETKGTIAVISAGTSDSAITEEAFLTAKALGCDARLVEDIGVAGLHRMLDHIKILREASAVIVVAGMDGALPSVVAGLINTPVIAVPTSAGYGASFGGVSALLAMLNSCASGVTVVNIDNGFGAGYFAGLVAKKLA